jgi:hypothetical protein
MAFDSAVLCPRCAVSLRPVAVSAARCAPCVSVRAACPTCGDEWTYAHWDRQAAPETAQKPLDLSPWTGAWPDAERREGS